MTLGRDGMLLVLAWAAGIMAALLAFAIARGEPAPIVSAGLALVAFNAGAAIGALIAGRRRSRGEWPPVLTEALACEGILLGVAVVVNALVRYRP
jgi:hypothetical protein